MDRALRPARRARAVEPERRVVSMRRRGGEFVISSFEQVIESERPIHPAVRVYDPHRLPEVSRSLTDVPVVHLVGDHDPGAAVLDEETVVASPQQRVYGNGDGPDTHRGEEGDGEGGRVVQH